MYRLLVLVTLADARTLGEMRRGRGNPRKMSTFKKKRSAGDSIFLEGKTESFQEETENKVNVLQNAK